MVFGGFVLYASYYGCDQTQAQRALSARNMGDIRKLLFANGILRFPITMLYCLVGLVVGVLAFSTPEFMAQIPSDRPDFMMPIFIIDYLPNGVIGLLLVAILAAAMSTLSSTINSLSAVTLEDMQMLGVKAESGKNEVLISRIIAFVWGLLILIMSAFAGNIAATVIEAINKVGSALYGPILAVFLMGILSKSIGAKAINIGMITGLVVNLYMWKFMPNVFWMWWNVIGLLVTGAVSYLAHAVIGKHAPMPPVVEDRVEVDESERPGLSSGLLAGYFVLIVGVSFAIGGMAA